MPLTEHHDEWRRRKPPVVFWGPLGGQRGGKRGSHRIVSNLPCITAIILTLEVDILAGCVKLEMLDQLENSFIGSLGNLGFFNPRRKAQLRQPGWPFPEGARVPVRACRFQRTKKA